MSRAGKKAFDQCESKVVTFTDYVFTRPTELQSGQTDFVVPRTGLGSVDKVKVENGTNGRYAGSGASLKCPVTQASEQEMESQYSNHYGRLKALDSLRQIAGEVICRNCRFSGMTQVEVITERAALLRAQAEETEALAALESARNELRQVNPHLLPAQDHSRELEE